MTEDQLEVQDYTECCHFIRYMHHHYRYLGILGAMIKKKTSFTVHNTFLYLTLVFFDGLHAHDNGKLYVGCWVPVAYNEGFFIGQVTSAQSAENILINFLIKSRNEMYKWPRRKDSDSAPNTYFALLCECRKLVTHML